MKGIIDKNNEVWIEEIPTKTYHVICELARQIGKKDPTFRPTIEYIGKNPTRVTNLTYWVRDGSPDFCGTINRKIPNGIDVHFHDLFYPSLVEELRKRGIIIQKGESRFRLLPIELRG